LNTLFVAGSLSISAFLLLALLQLMQHRDQMERLRTHPEVMDSAVEELLRHNLAIGDGLPRIATKDTELGGTAIVKGDLLVLVEGAIFDLTVFRDPHQLDLTRKPKCATGLRRGPALRLRHLSPAPTHRSRSPLFWIA
jgi:cytochrome P450